MDILDFVEEFQGKKVDYDGAYGPQCVDLFRMWCEKNNVPRTPSVGGAKEIWDKPGTLKKRSGVAMLKPNDALIYGATKSNPYGHVCLLVEKYNSKLIVFEQDGFKQDGAKLVLRTTDNLLGGLYA